MSYLHRVCIAAGVAVMNGHTEQGLKLKSGLRSLHQGRKMFSNSSSTASSAAGIDHTADLRPLSSILSTDVGAGGLIGEENRRNLAEESIRKVMYMNCWGPS